MNDNKQEAYMKVRDELLQKKKLLADLHLDVAGDRPMSSHLVDVLDGIDYVLVVIDNLMIQDRTES